MTQDLDNKDFYWELMEKKKEKIIKKLRKTEKEVDYDPKKLIELTFPNLNNEEIYKIWTLNKLLNKFFEEENTVQEHNIIKNPTN